jgi:RNA polymerase sigma factor (sigma-70 family)
MTKDEIAAYAAECAEVFCREHRIDKQEWGDFQNEAVLAVLERCAGLLAVNKGFLSRTAKMEMLKYWRRETNAGIGSHNVAAFEYVSLADAVSGAADDDGEPLTYGDLLVYDDPPRGYGDPADETQHQDDDRRLARAIASLDERDRALADLLRAGESQLEIAARLGISAVAVHHRTSTLVRRLKYLISEG